MHTNPLFLGLLISGFFAIACFKARAADLGDVALTPRNFLRLTDRLERLRRTRWQWCAMVLIIVAVRLQSGSPVVAEVTAAIQFVIFLALPVEKKSPTSIDTAARRTLPGSAAKKIRNSKAGRGLRMSAQ